MIDIPKDINIVVLTLCVRVPGIASTEASIVDRET
jgi:hypothetical protein